MKLEHSISDLRVLAQTVKSRVVRDEIEGTLDAAERTPSKADEYIADVQALLKALNIL